MNFSLGRATPMLAALALAMAGCGGGDDNKSSGGGGDNSSALSKSEFQSQANEICKQHNADIEKLGTPSGFDDIASYADKALKTTDDALAKLRELEPPAEFKEDFNQWLAYGDELGETVDELKQAAADEDEEGLKAAGEKAAARDTKSDAIATRIGIADCAEG